MAVSAAKKIVFSVIGATHKSRKHNKLHQASIRAKAARSGKKNSH